MRQALHRGKITPHSSRPRLRCTAIILTAAALLVVGALTHPAGAGDIDWVGSVSTDFDTKGNWKPPMVPGNGDRAILDTTAAPKRLTITGAAGNTNLAIVVRNGAFRLSAAGGTYKLTAVSNSVLVGEAAGNNGSLTLTGGTLSGVRGRLGEAAKSMGMATVTGGGSTWTNSDGLIVGHGGKGELTIEKGGLVTSAFARVGNLADSDGTVTVTGDRSRWINHAGSLTVGDAGRGTLSIEDGGVVTNTLSGFIGYAKDSDGRVTVTGVNATTGAHSTWTNSGDLVVGGVGTGVLMVQNGGVVTSKGGSIGESAGLKGTATVTGGGSTWTNSGELRVGDEGKGELTIQKGGAVGNRDGSIGAAERSNGMVRVTDAGSKWTNSGHLQVGVFGKGKLTIQKGGAVGNRDGFIGSAERSNGTVTVTGAGSTWTNSGNLAVGFGGKGGLRIEDGGVVTNENARIGSAAGSLGTVTVTGVNATTRARSTWTNRSFLDVGGAGTGVLRVENGGMVTNTTGTIGGGATSNGMVTVTGVNATTRAHSTWDNAGRLVVGGEGTGELMVQDRGVVMNTDGEIGLGARSNGIVTVTDKGSTWTNMGDLTVGHRGTGELTVQNGGGVVTNTDGEIGLGARSDGMVTVTGKGSTWNTGDLNVGVLGRGELRIENGGFVMNTRGEIGEFAGKGGMVTVTGVDPVTGERSTWSNTGRLVVGGEGTGELMVQDRGVVANTTGVIGRDDRSVGMVTVTGPGSKWTNRNELVVGFAGKGTLLVKDGGEVMNTNGVIGNVVNSNGTATVTDARSKWTNKNELVVGFRGKGELTVKNSGAVSVTGTTSVAVGSKVDVNGGTLTTGLLSGGGSVALNPAGFTALTLNDNNAAHSATFSGTISGAGDVLKIGASTQVLSGKNTDTGTLFDKSMNPGKVEITKTGKWAGKIMVGGSPGTVINDGTVIGQTDVNDGGLAKGTGRYGAIIVHAGGTLFPGDIGPGILTGTGNYTQAAGGQLDILIGGASPGSGFSQLNISGAASLDGTLDLSLIHGFHPFNNEQFVILTSSDLSGVFSTVDGLHEGNVNFTVEYSPAGFANDVVIKAKVSAVPEPSSLVQGLVALVILGGVSWWCRSRGRSSRPESRSVPISSRWCFSITPRHRECVG
jgi:T5SS/PEP-CTERM-associated repeat protein